jgi:hypothetical protein
MTSTILETRLILMTCLLHTWTTRLILTCQSLRLPLHPLTGALISTAVNMIILFDLLTSLIRRPLCLDPLSKCLQPVFVYMNHSTCILCDILGDQEVN